MAFCCQALPQALPWIQDPGLAVSQEHRGKAEGGACVVMIQQTTQLSSCTRSFTVLEQVKWPWWERTTPQGTEGWVLPTGSKKLQPSIQHHTGHWTLPPVKRAERPFPRETSDEPTAPSTFWPLSWDPTKLSCARPPDPQTLRGHRSMLSASSFMVILLQIKQ